MHPFEHPLNDILYLHFIKDFMTSKIKTLLAAILLSGICFGQITNALRLKEKRYYAEKNTFSSDTTVNLRQEVCYNKPGVIDEEYCFILNIIISDTLKAKQLKKIDLAKDSSIIKCTWDLLSVWNWEDESTTISGIVTIVSWTKKAIEVDLNVEAYDNRHKEGYSYKGRRRFSKTKNVTPADDDD
jgi:hypothetical protein